MDLPLLLLVALLGAKADQVLELARRWAPLVWLAPGEEYMPGDASEFLRETRPWHPGETIKDQNNIPQGKASRSWFLVPKTNLALLLKNSSSMLHGLRPGLGSVPVYASWRRCSAGELQLSFWLFFPWSQGKRLCSLGPWPVPARADACPEPWRRVFGSHLGDWEHASLLFQNTSSAPSRLFVATHNTGATYRYDDASRTFVASGRNSAVFPDRVQLSAGHPVLYAARGSHGLWGTPGRHEYSVALGLQDECGKGTAWETWRQVEMVKPGAPGAPGAPSWSRYEGRWGSPARKCAPLLPVAAACRLAPGPLSITARKADFSHCKSVGFT